jgi:signal transduction histidine kinase
MPQAARTPGVANATTMPNVRTVSWIVLLGVAFLLTGIGFFLTVHLESAIETASLIARPHEIQTELEHGKATLESLQDAVQDFLIDGADGMRVQYEDAVRAAGAQMSELYAFSDNGIAAGELAELDAHLKAALATSRAVIDLRQAKGAAAARQGQADALAALVASERNFDALIAAQQEVLQVRQRTLRGDVARMFGGLVATAGIVVCVLAGAVGLIEFDQRRQIAARKSLVSENERLENAVQERSATLALANRELSWFAKRALQIQENERRSLALELHDQVGQVLASLVHTLTHCEAEVPPELAGIKSTLMDGIEIARAAYGDVHNLALDLRPAMLDRLGLVPTLQSHARKQARLSGCEITVDADEFPAGLPYDLLIAAFRIVQESVSNAIRHARPQHIQIEARYRSGSVELQIVDDGAGFDLAAAISHPEPRVGLGLVGLRQRAQDFGGAIAIESSPGSGTRVHATLRVPEPVRA